MPTSRSTPDIPDQQLELFVTYLSDIAPRDARDTMERPFFSLAKSKRLKPIDYISPDGRVSVRVTAPAQTGIATIYDKDILVWAISQIREAVDQGHKTSRILTYHPYNLLRGIQRDVGGENYRLLKLALARLAGTYIETNIRAPSSNRTIGFHWLEGWTADEHPHTGEPVDFWTMTLPNWLYQAALSHTDILTISEDYFLLTGGMERALYLLVRKHAGNQEFGWYVSLKGVCEKIGSMQELKYIKRQIRLIVKRNDLPDYHLELGRNEYGEELLRAVRRSCLPLGHSGFQPLSARRVRVLTMQ